MQVAPDGKPQQDDQLVRPTVQKLRPAVSFAEGANVAYITRDLVRIEAGHRPCFLLYYLAEDPMNDPIAVTASDVVATLRVHEPALRRAGITRLSLFGSVARNEAGPDSDIDLVAEFDPATKMNLIRLVGLEQELSDLLGREVQILPEPIRKERLRAHVERDRIRAF